MSARLWQAVAAVADVWRASEVVQRYSAAALGSGVNTMYPSDGHVDAQPFYLCRYAATRVTFGQDMDQRSQPPEWIVDGARLGDAYTILIEFLRSRLPGYPFAGMPQLSANSHWTSFTVNMTVPWLQFWHDWNMQDRRTPPVFPEIAVDHTAQLPAMSELTAAFQSCAPALQAAAAWQELSDADRAQLTNARSAFDMARYPERADQTTGEEDFRHLAWARTQLDAITSRLDGRARTFCDALTAVDRLLQQVAALFSHLVFYGRIRLLDDIELVEQLDGSNGWHTVRSGQFVFRPFRIHEIVGFNHPYPNGLMVIEGTNDQLPFGIHAGAMTLHGRLLPDSATLAQSLPTALA